MSELRKDPIVGRWVIIASNRAKRPNEFYQPTPSTRAGFCPFCEGNEEKTPPEIVALRSEKSKANGPGWRVRVVPNKFPALRVEGNLEKKGEGIYDRMNGIGAHEVIIETPEHKINLTELSSKNVQEVLWIYRERLGDLKRDQRLRHALVFKNVGERAGASLEHTHSQIIATPTIPKAISEELRGSKQYYDFRGRCVYCDILEQELEQAKRIVADSIHFLVITPFAPRFPFETWIIPKRHATHFENIQPAEAEDLAYVLKMTLEKIGIALNFAPYNYIVHSSPFQERDLECYHWHLEIIPRITRVAGFEWGTGFYINTVSPEEAVRFLEDIEVTVR